MNSWNSGIPGHPLISNMKMATDFYAFKSVAIFQAILNISFVLVAGFPLKTVNLPFISMPKSSAIKALTATSFTGANRFARARSHLRIAGAERPRSLPNFSRDKSWDLRKKLTFKRI